MVSASAQRAVSRARRSQQAGRAAVDAGAATVAYVTCPLGVHISLLRTCVYCTSDMTESIPPRRSPEDEALPDVVPDLVVSDLVTAFAIGDLAGCVCHVHVPA
ncbi:hypothetical protein GCM10010207_79650 [Streptomyces atratus]|nr:hypothetical protein GCM10010207_79650 [Streptomyces atratus]